MEKKDKPPLAGLALPVMGHGDSGTVLSFLSLNSEENQRWGDDSDSDSRLSKDAGRKTVLSRSPACGQQSALMMLYSLSHCQG